MRDIPTYTGTHTHNAYGANGKANRLEKGRIQKQIHLYGRLGTLKMNAKFLSYPVSIGRHQCK